jgi:small-conductance mechanosensitive channel
MTPEKDLLYTLIEYLNHEDKQELGNIIKHSRIIYEKKWEFSGVVSNQHQLEIIIKTPITYKTILEKNKEILEEICFEVYENDEDYMATSVNIKVLASHVTTVEIQNLEKEIVENSTYQSFIKEILELKLDDIEKKYLYEACECAMRDNRLAASTMLGCAAEYLLLNMCNAYFIYLEKNNSEKEVENYKKKCSMQNQLIID